MADDVLTSVGLLLFVSGWVLWRQKQAVILPLLLSGVCTLAGGAALFGIHYFYTWLYMPAQSAGMSGWTFSWLVAPRWPTGLVMHLTGNVWLAPLAAIFCLSISPLNFALMAGLPRWRKALQICGLAVAITIVLLAAGVIFYGRERAL